MKVLYNIWKWHGLLWCDLQNFCYAKWIFRLYIQKQHILVAYMKNLGYYSLKKMLDKFKKKSAV